MSNVKAVLCREFGEPSDLVIESITIPVPQGNEVRIKVHAVGMNLVENFMVTGQFQYPPPALPFIPGFEVSGEIVECGSEVADFQLGDRVIALTCYGAYAEEIVLSTENVVAIPDKLDSLTAAAFPVSYATAYVSLLHRGGLGAGETLLVHGASGNVGSAAVEIGKRVGATVIGVAGNPELRVQPDFAVNYKQENIAERVMEITDGRGANVILDLVGGTAFAASLDCIAWEGRLLFVGAASGVIPDINALSILTKNIAVIGEDIAGYVVRDIQVVKQALTQLIEWYKEGALQPVTPKSFPLVEAGQALKMIVENKAGRKLALTIN